MILDSTNSCQRMRETASESKRMQTTASACERVRANASARERQVLYAMGRVLLNVLFAILKLRACHANRLLDRGKSSIIDRVSFHAAG